jgi:ribonuclease VapC
VVIDTSASIALLSDEPERRRSNEAIEVAEWAALSAASFEETFLVLETIFGSEGLRALDFFLGLASSSLRSTSPTPSLRVEHSARSERDAILPG